MYFYSYQKKRLPLRDKFTSSAMWIESVKSRLFLISCHSVFTKEQNVATVRAVAFYSYHVLFNNVCHAVSVWEL